MMTVGSETIRAWESQEHVFEKVPKESNGVVSGQDASETAIRLFRRHYDEVFRYCVHRLFNRTDAEDVTSTVFLQVVKYLPRFRGDDPQLRGWLFRIATNTINTHLRRRRKHRRLLETAAQQAVEQVVAPSPSDELARQKALLKQAMLQLKARHQTVIALRFFEKMSSAEIAEILGGSPGTIRSQVSRALVQLRKKMRTVETLVSPEV